MADFWNEQDHGDENPSPESTIKEQPFNWKIGVSLKTQGNEHFKKADYVPAIRCYKDAIDNLLYGLPKNEGTGASTEKPEEVDKELMASYMNISWCYTKCKNMHGLDYANRAIKMNPKSAKAWYRRAESNLESNKFNDAVRDYEHVLRLEPNNAEAKSALERAKFKLGEFDSAKDMLLLPKVEDDQVTECTVTFENGETIAYKSKPESNPYVISYANNVEKPWEEGKKEFDALMTDKEAMQERFFEVKAEGGDYMGELKPDINIRHGWGVIMFHNKEIYMGHFHEDEFDGYGEYRYPDKSGYIGQFRKGMREVGRENYPNGDYYIGEFNGWKKHGLGYCTYWDGSYYEGRFIDGVRGGWGKLCRPGMTMEGEFVKDNLFGVGKATFYGGHTYVGQFFNNSFMGQGMLSMKDGHKIEAKFAMMEIQGEAKETQADGTTWTGKFNSEYSKHGKGKVVYAQLFNKGTFWAYFDHGRFVKHEDLEGYKDGQPIQA